MTTPAVQGRGRLVQEYATGYLHTRITAYPHGRYAWQRRPGADRSSRLRPAGLSFREKAQASGRGSVRFALALPRPAAADGTLTYVTAGHRSAAALLSAPISPRHGQQLLAAMTGCGRTLNALHQQPHPQAPAAPAPGPSRLWSWMDTADGTRAAGLLHTRMREHLGRERWGRLRQWCEGALTSYGAPMVTLHGGFGLGQIVLADQPEEGAVVLAGEDATAGPAWLDLGWLLGELAELHMLTQHARKPQPLLARARENFLAGYGTLPDPAAVARTAVLRLATHTHDFAAFVGWHPELLHYISHLADLIDEEGASALTAW